MFRCLYGHPDSGGMWEKHCDSIVKDRGFTPIPEWPSCYVHLELGLFLVVYVDDVLLSGPTANVKTGWDLLRAGAEDGTGIILDEPTLCNRFLGCHHVFESKINPATKIEVNACTFDMSDYMVSCCQQYKDLTGVTFL